MALKTIFKGTINGKEFDNVKDYNAEMTRLIKENETIDAKSETRMAKACTQEQCNKKLSKEEHVDMLPFFTQPGYLDRLVSTDPNTNNRVIEDLEKFFNEHFEKIDKQTDKFDVNQLNDYVKDIERVLKQLECDSNKTIKCLDKIEEKATELENKRNCLVASFDIIGMLEDFYEKLRTKTTNKTTKFQVESCSPPCEERQNPCKSDIGDFWDDLLKLLS